MVNGEGQSTISQAALGRALGLSPAAVTKLKQQGMPVDSVQAAQAWREQRQNVAQRKPLPAGAPVPRRPAAAPPSPPADEWLLSEDHDSARTRLRISEANQAEMLEAEMRGELIRLDVVRSQLASVLSSTRDSLMQIPSRLSAVLAAEGDAARVHQLLQAEIHQALSQLVAAPDRLAPGGGVQ